MDDARKAWHASWSAAAAGPHCNRLDALHAELDALNRPDEDIELEREMLDGLVACCALLAQLELAGLPVVETQHRVIGAEPCHFSAPAFMPDDPSQPAGRLLFTATRAIFVGGGNPSIVPWHSIGAVHHAGRDVLFMGVEDGRVSRFRTNSHADALCGAQLARRLLPRRTGKL